jgi:hypothetical protein
VVENDEKGRDAAGAAFEREGARARSGGPLREFWHYLSRSGKWWLTPIIALLVLIGGLVVIGGTGAAPFIYALF